MDTRIYVMTHKKLGELPGNLYIPMQVGRYGKEDFGYLGDDTGDNISRKNDSYCELTGVYWLWKHVKCDNIGICHYRRFFATKDGKILGQGYIERVLEKYPIIVPSSGRIRGRNMREHYGERHHRGDLDLCRQAVAEKYPQYLPAFDYSMQSTLFSIANMWITRKEIFDRYCEWLFDILFQTEEWIDLSGYDSYQRRVMGFLSERLFRAWLYMQPEAVTEEELVTVEPQEIANKRRETELMYRCARLEFMPVIRLYQSGAMEGKSLASPIACKDDFEGKTPVWVCWWEGEAQMPEAVCCCVESLKRNLPGEKAVFRLITLENCMEYVTFTDAVLCKYNKGEISSFELSMLLRAELLFRYGGMWIDSAYYVTQPIPEEIFLRKGIYTLQLEEDFWCTDIVHGRWEAGLWCAGKGETLFQFLMECLWYYWEVENEPAEYLQADNIIALAWEFLPGVKEKLKQPVRLPREVLSPKWLERKYESGQFEEIMGRSPFYRLDWTGDCRKENLVGEKTMYGHMVEG